jgi:hypothetical protein
MKRTRLLALVVLTLLLAVVVAPQPATARAIRTEITVTETWIRLIDPGVWTVLPSGNLHYRGLVYESLSEASDPRLNGICTVVRNLNWVPNVGGPGWGIIHVEVTPSPDCPGGGVWNLTYTGMYGADGSCQLHVVGHGVSGCVEGLELTATADLGVYPPFTGTILDPHGE